MASTIQIRNVPEDVSRRLKAMAAAQGQSLSDFLLEQVVTIADRPTLRELTDRVSRRTPISLDAAAVIRAAREERGAQLLAAHLGAQFVGPGRATDSD